MEYKYGTLCFFVTEGAKKISAVVLLFTVFFGCCRLRRNETAVKGSILFDAASTITLSPVNFQ
jgi:hypothetical protein